MSDMLCDCSDSVERLYNFYKTIHDKSGKKDYEQLRRQYKRPIKELGSSLDNVELNCQINMSDTKEDFNKLEESIKGQDALLLTRQIEELKESTGKVLSSVMSSIYNCRELEKK